MILVRRPSQICVKFDVEKTTLTFLVAGSFSSCNTISFPRNTTTRGASAGKIVSNKKSNGAAAKNLTQAIGEI